MQAEARGSDGTQTNSGGFGPLPERPLCYFCRRDGTRLQFVSGSEAHVHLNLRDVSQIGPGLDVLDAALSSAGSPRRSRHHHLLAVEEIVVNALAYSPTATEAGVTVDADVAASVVITTIVYPGPRFDVSDPAKIVPQDEDRIGGHGLRLLHALTRDVVYAHDDGINTVTLSQYWE